MPKEFDTDVLNLLGLREVNSMPPHFHYQTFKITNVAKFAMNKDPLTAQLYTEIRRPKFVSRDTVALEVRDWIQANLKGRFFLRVADSDSYFPECNLKVGFENKYELTFFALNMRHDSSAG